MMGENNTKKHQIKKIIYSHIVKHPGIHERELSRQLKIPLSTLDYHLYFLKKRKLVTGVSDGYYTKFYAEGKFSLKDEQLLGALRKKILRKIIIYLLLNNSANHKEVHTHVGLSPSTTSFHLKKLVDLGVVKKTVKGRNTYFQIKNPKYVSKTIKKYKNSFLDSNVDRFLDK
jgi:predicted transcriptional regulator